VWCPARCRRPAPPVPLPARDRGGDVLPAQGLGRYPRCGLRDRQSIRQVPFALAARFRPGRITLSLAPVRRGAMPRLLFGCSLLLSVAIVLRGEAPAAEPITPKEVIHLFNGKDLSGLSTWLKDTKREDPRKVFSVTDGQIHISGDGFGYVGTTKA